MRFRIGGYTASGALGEYQPGNGNIYIFNDDTYKYLSEDVPQDSGSYTITKAPNLNTNEIIPAIFFNNQYQVCFSINDDTLTLYQGLIAADGSTYKYKRIGDANFFAH